MKPTSTDTETIAQVEQHGLFVLLKAMERDGILEGFLNSLPADELELIRNELIDLMDRTGMTWGGTWEPLNHGIPAILWASFTR